MERYRSGYNEPHSKCGWRVTATWVRIPLSPLKKGLRHDDLIIRAKPLSKFISKNPVVSHSSNKDIQYAKMYKTVGFRYIYTEPKGLVGIRDTFPKRDKNI